MPWYSYHTICMNSWNGYKNFVYPFNSSVPNFKPLSIFIGQVSHLHKFAVTPLQAPKQHMRQELNITTSTRVNLTSKYNQPTWRDISDTWTSSQLQRPNNLISGNSAGCATVKVASDSTGTSSSYVSTSAIFNAYPTTQLQQLLD